MAAKSNSNPVNLEKESEQIERLQKLNLDYLNILSSKKLNPLHNLIEFNSHNTLFEFEIKMFEMKMRTSYKTSKC